MKTTMLLLPLLGFASFIQAATFSVTTAADSGVGSLRQAILDANAAAGDDTIAFTVTGTITLASALPAIADNTTITGPGTNLLTISGNNSVQVFTVNAGTTNAISGLTIANGRATGYANGAGIANAGTLSILNCALVNNKTFGGWGGAVFNSGELAILNSTFSGNQVTGENGYDRSGGGGAGMGGGIYTMSGTANIIGCSFTGNSAAGGAGGNQTMYSGTGRGGGINGGQAGTINNYSGQNGGYGGGGGGGVFTEGNGGAGGFGGGGGGAAECAVGGQGGVGGGAGGGKNGSTCYFGAGGGGGGLGGGIFVDSGTVTIVNCSFAGSNQVTGGLGGDGVSTGHGSNGSGIGADFYNRAGIILPKLTITTLGGGTVAANPPDAPYLDNSLATVTASPLTGWRFLYWLGDASGTNQTTNVNMTRNKYVQAIFATQLSGSALMSMNPQSDFYPYGTVVKLTALPPTGTYFASWSGNASGTNNPLNFTVASANQTVSFELGALNAGQFALTVIESGNGHVTVNPYANIYSSGQTVTLKAVPDRGQDFVGWGGDASGAQNPLAVTMNSSKTITATFTKRPSLRVGTPLEGLVEDGFRLTLTGEFGAQYQILGSTNLLDWLPMGTVTNTYGTTQFTDPAATNLPARFYRAKNLGN